MNYRRILFYFLIVFSIQISFCQINYDREIEKHLNQFQFDSAYVIVQKAIKNSKYNSEKRANYNIKYATILKSLSKTDSCFYYLDAAEKFYKTKQNQSKLFYILIIKAEISRFNVKRNIANSYIYEAEKLLPKNKNLDYKYYFLNRRIALLAEYYNNIPDSVIKIKKIANEILQNQNEIKDKSLIAYTLSEIGFLDFHRNPKNAKKYFLKAHEVAKKYESKMALIDISINLGRYFQQKEFNYILAKQYYQIGIKNAKKTNNLWQIQQCYNELKNTAFLSEDFKSAMQYGDSLNGTNNLINDFTNNKKYELLENKLIIQSKEKELLSSKKNFFLLITILILFVIGIIVLVFYSKKIHVKNIQLYKLNEENKFLISETNHRVNNNLQLISLLISETLRKKHNDENKLDFEKLLSKVETIASLHRHLYLAKDKDKIELKKYLFDVKNNFNQILKEKKINLSFDLDAANINPDNAMYLGLLVTELIINSIKHAFSETQKKNIQLNIKVNNNTNEINFEYFDNGILSNDRIIKPILVQQLCQQLNVNPVIISENGFHIKFTKKTENNA